MILTPFGPTIAYRMHTPRWAGTPTSGAGAGVHGGRDLAREKRIPY